MATKVHARVIPTNAEDPFGEEILTDPLPFQKRLRDAGPVVWLEKYDVYAMGRYAEVAAALHNWQQFQSSAGVGLSNFRTEAPWRPPSVLLEADPPHHYAPHSALARILGARQLRALEGPWALDASALVDELLDGPAEFDAVPALAEAFPLRVFPDAVGISPEGRDHLLPYGDHNFNTFGPENWLVQKGAGSIQDHIDWVNSQCQRTAIADDTFGSEVWAAADRGDITIEQAPLMVRSLLSAGVDTTVHAIGALIAACATNPHQWATLRANPALARTAFDEAIRLESPVQTFFRTATTDVTIGDVVIPDGKKILMFLGAANRDERHWDNPDSFDIGRDPAGHVGFGMGIHQCVGQHVARLEATTLIIELAKRVKTIELAGPPTRHLNNTLRAWEHLPLRITAA